MVKKPAKVLVFALFVLLPSLFQCAKEGMPPGGPEDTIPPEVISVSPKSGSTEVALDSKIEVIFSERMLAKITEESIFVSPLPKKPFEFAWRGKRLILAPSEPLLPDRTYVVSVGTNAQDLRRNRLSQSYTFAFSTGSRLDYGAISGQVWTKQKIGLEREIGASVWAYVLAPDRTEIDPQKEKPDYVTQTDNEGKYALKNLSLEKYRLFAVQDVNRDLIWDWEKETFGLTTGDVVLTEQDISKTHVDFILDKKDKSPPALLDCQSLNENLVRLEFDEELDERSPLKPANFKVFSASTQKPLTVTSAFFEGEGTKRIFLVTEGMNPQERYELEILKATDRAGNPMDTTSNTCLFEGSEIADTVGPAVLAVLPKDEETSVPFDTKIKLIFDEPLKQQTVETVFSLVDSNQIKIMGNGKWVSPTTFVFSPDSLLAGKMKYRIELSTQKIWDLSGNVSMMDSVFTSGFVTLDPNLLGSVSGEVQAEEETDDSIGIVLTLWHLKEAKLWYQVALPRPGPFVFEGVLPGKYFLGGCLDLNGDGNLTLGQPEPFSSMEPFAVYSDTIAVRSRWETESIELKFH